MKHLWGILALCLLSVSANAAPISGQGTWETTLHKRAGGLAYYDSARGITWVADANLAKTLGYDPSGQMAWQDPPLPQAGVQDAQDWIASLVYLGMSGWRLPTTAQPDTSCSTSNSSGDYYDWDCIGSEMGYMHNVTLGNSKSLNSGCGGFSCLTNTGPFQNMQPASYWSSTLTAVAPELRAFAFSFNQGRQFFTVFTLNNYAWAVRDGDIGNVPFDDADGDGIANSVDNCSERSNASQCDSDGDGYGNHCDGDLNNNAVTNSQDYLLFRQQLGQPSTSPNYNQADLNCNSIVNSQDYLLFRARLGIPSGPSGLHP